MDTQTIDPQNLEKDSNQGKASIKVNVELLDTLMNLAGELVLGRNQLLQGVGASNPKATELSSQRIDMITSELQEAIMKTRMQPISNVFNQFNRVVRDRSSELEKSIELVIKGKNVELDKTILEAIGAPLAWLMENAVTHGIETPLEREQADKKTQGKIILKAFHDAGQVNIVISDDGRGLTPDKTADAAVNMGLVTDLQVAEMSDKQKNELIFISGFSIAEAASKSPNQSKDMAGVAKTVDGLGGIIELESTPGKGTDIQIKLPLTLAIIPSQIVSVESERYAVPQVNLNELLRIPAAEVKNTIEVVGDAPVVRLRGELLPLLNLPEMLGIKKTYTNFKTNERLEERRLSIADRRSVHHTLSDDGILISQKENEQESNRREKTDRRAHGNYAINIAVVSAGAFKYGLIVDQLHDSEEIVVKPVGRHLKNCTAFAGATIMGDGKVALILDISNLAQMANLSTTADAGLKEPGVEEKTENIKDVTGLLTFKNSPDEHFAVLLSLVERIERIKVADIEQIGNTKVIQYRDGALPLYGLSQIGAFGSLPQTLHREVVVFKIMEREIGLMINPPADAVDVKLDLDEETLIGPAIQGSMIINGNTTLIVDLAEMMRILAPGALETPSQEVLNHG